VSQQGFDDAQMASVTRTVQRCKAIPAACVDICAA